MGNTARGHPSGHMGNVEMGDWEISNRKPVIKFLHDWRMRTILPFISGHLLDVGCGGNKLVRSYGNGIGVDVYAWGDVDILVEDSSRLPFEDESFDTVTIIAALNHIPNRDEVMKEAHRVLKKGSKLIVTFNPPIVSRIWHFIVRPWDPDQTVRGIMPGEMFGLKRKYVIQLMEEAGLSIVFEKRFMFWINRLMIAVKRRRSVHQAAE